MKRLVIYGFTILGLSTAYLLMQVESFKLRDQILADDVTYISGNSDFQLAPIDLDLKRNEAKFNQLLKKI